MITLSLAPRLLLALLAGAFASGCYTTTLRSGRPAAPNEPTIANQDRWHSGVIVGIAELSGPYDLDALCPNGWAEIHTETSFLNGLVEALTSNVYNPQSITVLCAAGSAPPPAAP